MYASLTAQYVLWILVLANSMALRTLFFGIDANPNTYNNPKPNCNTNANADTDTDPNPNTNTNAVFLVRTPARGLTTPSTPTTGTSCAQSLP